jgi:hypothetical protein
VCICVNHGNAAIQRCSELTLVAQGSLLAIRTNVGSANMATMSTTEASTLVAQALHRISVKRLVAASALHGRSPHDAAIAKAAFATAPITKQPPVVDWVLASGIFAFGSRAFFHTMVTHSVGMARRGFVFNIHETEDTRFLLLSREEARLFCETLPGVGSVAITDGYWRADYTVCVNKLQ